MTDISATELSEIYQFAIQLGKDAGKILLDGLERRRLGEDEPEEMVEKVNAVDIVTKTDHGNLILFPHPPGTITPPPTSTPDLTPTPPPLTRLTFPLHNQRSKHSSNPPSSTATQTTPSSAKNPTPPAPQKTT